MFCRTSLARCLKLLPLSLMSNVGDGVLRYFELISITGSLQGRESRMTTILIGILKDFVFFLFIVAIQPVAFPSLSYT
jgi:hypothetical protein